MKVEHVENLLHKLDMNKATCFDQIPPKIFPDDIKRAEVIPIFKKKDDMNKTNL